MNPEAVEDAVRQAYRFGEKIESQGERVRIQGYFGKLRIEMWVNRSTKTIETAYPITNK